MIFKILRNILSLLTGHVVSKLFALICVIFLARRLGVGGFGTYETVMAYLTLFAAFADSGMGTVTIRDVAQDYARSDSYFAHVLTLRLLLTMGAYLLLLLLGGIWKTGGFSLWFIASCGLFLFPEALRNLGVSMLSAYERMDLVAMLNVLSIVVRYLPFFLVILLGKSVLTAFPILVVCWGGIAGIWLLTTKKYCLTRWISPIHPQKLWHILRESFPFGVLFVLSVIYFKADTIMLAKMKGQVDVGYYNGAYKFVEASMFIPISIVNVLLPVMSRSFVTDKASYHNIYIHSTRILAMSILPVVMFVSFFSKNIILLIFKDAYLPSASALSLIIWTLFFIFINAPVGNIIASSNTMHAFLPYAIGNTLLKILLNLIVIPKYGFAGASVTTVLAECTGFITQLYFANRIIGNASRILWIIGKLFVAGLTTSAMLSVVKPYLSLPLNAVILVGTYTVSLFVLKVIEPDDKQLCLEILKKIRSW